MSIAHDDRYYRQNVYASPSTTWEAAPLPDRPALPYLLSFHGRAARGQFWVVSILANLSYIAVLMLAEERLDSLSNPLISRAVLTSSFVFYMWVSTAIQVKRCHDLGMHGAFVLIGFIPVLGMLWRVIYLGFLPGTPGENSYGPDPLQASITDEDE